MVAQVKPGPVGRPEQVLRDAAIEYCAELEADPWVRGTTRHANMPLVWDKLRHAAIRYAEAEKRKGRPRKEER